MKGQATGYMHILVIKLKKDLICGKYEKSQISSWKDNLIEVGKSLEQAKLSYIKRCYPKGQ